MKTIFTKMNAISKMRIDVVRSLWYSRKWPAVCGRFIVAGRTRVDAGKNGLLREGSVRIGCPKGIFGYIGIPGTDSTLIKVDDGGMLRLGDGVCIYAGGRIIIAGQGCVEIGKDTSIAANTYLLSRNRITIGSGCAISWDCQIMDTDFHEIQDEYDPPAGDAPVTIGDHVLICSKVTILKGVNIGSNAVIAANSVVTRDVPAGCIAAGNPAKIIKENICWN